MNGAQLMRLLGPHDRATRLGEYVRYYHDDRTHLGLRSKLRQGRKSRRQMIGPKLSRCLASTACIIGTTSQPEARLKRAS